jgi:hypothetical protein
VTDPVAAVASAADLVTPMALRVAATLRLADLLATGPAAARALAGAAGADPDALDRLLCHLAVVGLVARADDGGYALTDRGQVLRDDHPSGLRARLDAEGAIGRGDLAFAQLLHSVRTGEAGYPRQYGDEFWADLAGDPARRATYDAQMGRDVAAWAPPVLAALDGTAFGHVVDVGGGNGTLLAAILREHPTARGTVLDQPATAVAARSALAAAGLGDRADAVGGSFFDPIAAGADVYLLCAVLHDWDDASARAILQRCADAAGPSGLVVVVEKTGREGAPPPSAMNLRVLVYFGGRERGVDALTELATAVGLARRALHRDGDLCVLTFSAG